MNIKLATFLFFAATPAIPLPAMAQNVANVSSSPAALMRSGLEQAVQSGHFPMDPPDLYNAVLAALSEIEAGSPMEQAAYNNQLRVSVLNQLMEMGGTPEPQPPINYPTLTTAEPPQPAQSFDPPQTIETEPLEGEKQLPKEVLKELKALREQQKELKSQIQDLEQSLERIDQQGSVFLARLTTLEQRNQQQDIFLASENKPEPEAEAEPVSKAEPVSRAEETQPTIEELPQLFHPELKIAARPDRPVPIYPQAEGNTETEQPTTYQIAHAIRSGLIAMQGRKEVPYGSRNYSKTQGAIRLLNRGNSIDTAASRVGLDPSVLSTLARYGGLQ